MTFETISDHLHKLRAHFRYDYWEDQLTKSGEFADRSHLHNIYITTMLHNTHLGQATTAFRIIRLNYKI